MLEIDSLIAFFTASILLALIPGPDNIYVLTQSIMQGKKAAFMIIFGLCTGLLFHTLMVVIGVSVIFQTSLFAFTLLKIVGATYLLYLAWQLFRSSNSKLKFNKNILVDYKKLYLKGIFMNITNPKVFIFFLAFFPQFTNEKIGNINLQILILGLLFIISTILVFGLIAIFSSTLSNFFTNSILAQKILNRLTSFIFLALAIKLVITKQ
ncbi:LysE family translocator [Arcobacter cloacae]|uniref:Threonine transporter RhtB n=1 Tax=Arcobacter cloacae TaxID=1054034 RepID=A0A4Q0ZFN9_9BACT|nr:LysE family translocator [Arcobacter cloacae]RXJ84650.1 threonine transporter RhtB [Arcobacter cloacae]